MSNATPTPTAAGFTKTFLLPTLWVFLIPGLSLAFFWHAQSTFDQNNREQLLQAIRADKELTDEERAIVEQAFPETRFVGKEGAATLDFEKLLAPGWEDPVRFDEVTGMSLNDNNVLQVAFKREKVRNRSIKLKKFSSEQQELLEQINHYYTRYLTAVDYQQHLKEGRQAP